jgi:hypothetical protein
MLDIEHSPIPHSVQEYADKHGFVPKTEFHITVIGNRKAGALKATLDPIRMQEMLNAAKVFEWCFESLCEYYHIERVYDGLRESIIQKVTLPDLKRFYDVINSASGKSFEIPFAHYTLFTKGTDPKASRGVSIESEDEFIHVNPRAI